MLSYRGHSYLASDPGSWVVTEAQAQALGGHLVTINDAAENEWVRQNFSYLGNLWIGFTDRDVEGTFVWTSSEPVTYTAWNAANPITRAVKIMRACTITSGVE